MNIFSEKRYKLYFKPSIAEKVAEETTDGQPTYIVTARLQKSGCFEYGNGTAVGLYFENLPPTYERVKGFDTRYDNTVTKDFDKWCRDYFEADYGKNLERVEDISS